MGKPRLIVVAGSNGAGKSTLTRHLRGPGLSIIDPDAIARCEKLSAVAAGRRALTEFNSHCQQRQSFVVETTLSGRVLLSKLRNAKADRFLIELYYVGLAHPELAKARVRQRVVLGGHDVPPEDIERRFHRSLANLPEALQLADASWFLDNSGKEGPRVVARITSDGVHKEALLYSDRCWWARRALVEAGFRL